MVNLDKQRDAIGLDLTGEYYGSERRCSITRRPKQAWKERKTVTIDRISESGNPIAETKHHDKHVHVPGANPGETVEVLIEEDHGNFFKWFMIGPNGISTREAKKKRERKERQEKRKQAKKKRKQEPKNWEERKERQEEGIGTISTGNSESYGPMSITTEFRRKRRSSYRWISKKRQRKRDKRRSRY